MFVSSEGIESVQIVQVAVANGFLLTEMEQNAVDFTVSCQGRWGLAKHEVGTTKYSLMENSWPYLLLFSLPTEVCTVVSDADCHMPVMTICNAVSPSSDCQLILRHFFNDSGIFCINVSMTNDVSLAVTNARVNINIGEFIHCWNVMHGAPEWEQFFKMLLCYWIILHVSISVTNLAGSRLTSAGVAALFLAILTVASALGAVAFAYKWVILTQRNIHALIYLAGMNHSWIIINYSKCSFRFTKA